MLPYCLEMLYNMRNDDRLTPDQKIENNNYAVITRLIMQHRGLPLPSGVPEYNPELV